MKMIERSGEIISAARITVRPENRRELCLTISALLDPIRHQKGCRTYSFYGEVQDQNSLMLIGEWDTLAAWENHLKSDHFAVLIGSLRLLSSSRSNLTFNLFSRAVGKEALDRIGDATALEAQSPISH
jgi:quinol monooxygenase YgiN